MEVNKVHKKAKISKWEVVFYQLMSYCFFNKIELSEADINCVVFFVLNKTNSISEFCIKTCEKGIFKTPQSVRNSLNKIVKKGILLRDRKTSPLYINPAIGLVYDGNILLNYNLLALETDKS